MYCIFDCMYLIYSLLEGKNYQSTYSDLFQLLSIFTAKFKVEKKLTKEYSYNPKRFLGCYKNIQYIISLCSTFTKA